MLESLNNFISTQFNSLNFTPINICEILLLAIVMYLSYRKYIKGTHSEKFVKGVFILIVFWIVSEFLIKINLQILGGFLKTMTIVISFSLVVIFQPELRRFLGYLGQGGIFAKYLNKNEDKPERINILTEIMESIKYLKKTRTGALIVFQKDDSAEDNYEIQTEIDARVSQELLLTIFHPNTPLHDGAVIIKNEKIFAAGVVLPLTNDPKLSWKYGTRHRAAIGMSEVSDTACLVISEETGEVSLCIDGVLKKYDDLTMLKIDLEKILGYNQKDIEEKRMFNFITIRKNKIDTTANKG